MARAVEPGDGGREAQPRDLEIEPRDGGVCLLTVVHDQLEGSPITAGEVAGEGWMGVLSSLKSLLETGDGLPLSAS